MTDSVLSPTQVASGSQEFTWSWFLFSAQGRISRSDYWLRYVLPYSIISIILMFIDGMMGQNLEQA